MSNLLAQIKADAMEGNNSARQYVFFLKNDSKARIRFLQELDDGSMVVMHNRLYEAQDQSLPMRVLCQGPNCPYCNNPEMNKGKFYCWTVWNYDTQRKEILMYKNNKFTPVPQLLSYNETFHTVCDRDYMISTTGSQLQKTISVIPLDKSPNTIQQAPYTEQQVVEILKKAYPAPAQTQPAAAAAIEKAFDASPLPPLPF